MVVDHRQSHLESVRSILSTLIYPLQYAVNIPVKVGNWMSESLVTQRMLLEENNRLHEEHLLLSSRLQKFNVIEEENKRLRELFESSVRLGERVLIAELIAVEQEPFRRKFLIDKGQREGVYNGQPVVNATGVMGQIIHVASFSSTVLLITDPKHALPVQINRNGLRAIAVGTGKDNALLLENVPSNADIKQGRFGNIIGTWESVSSWISGRYDNRHKYGSRGSIFKSYIDTECKVGSEQGSAAGLAI